MDERDRYWLAGLLEGEASFMKPAPSAPNKPIIRLQMTDRDVVARAAILMGVKCSEHQWSKRYADKDWKPTFMATVKGIRAVQLMRDLYPLLGERRQAQIDRALAAYTPRQPKISETDAQELARRYHAGDRHPTALGREFGIGKNHAIYFINKYAPA